LQPADATASIPDIATSKAIVEAFKAKLIQLEFDERSAKLVDATEFRTRFSTMVATARTRLLGVASKAKGRIPHLTINEIEVLTKLIREALEGLPEACERVQALLDGIREQWSPLVDDLPATAATAGERS
jgi:phage terminase Nu1 subunit (DNA packaging protein)